jgi:uncharacterized surface protein with fasciclin (FAS1) repeats
MRSTLQHWTLFILLVAAGAGSCKKWDDHVAVQEQALNENLMDHISAVPELSKFSEYLVKTGLDKEISASKNHTVWAPVNKALESLPATLVNDTAKLKALLLNHISGQLFFTRMASDTIRVPMMNGKRVVFYRNTFDDAAITGADGYVRNGVLHIIDKVIAPQPNVWEYIQSTTGVYTQNAYVASLVYLSQDPSKAVLDSINPVTGEPVYKPNTGIVEINTYRTKVADLANEDSLYTYLLLNNGAFVTETGKQQPYFKSADAAIATANASWNVVKDMAVPGMYQPGQLPAAFTSRFNVHVAVNKADIVESIKVSNGIVYVLKAATAPMEEKIPVVMVQGENPAGFRFSDDKTLAKIFYRQRKDSAGRSTRDIYLNLGSGGAGFYVDYNSNNLYTTRYKVYWVAMNDKSLSGQADDPYGTDSTLQQILQIGPYATAGTFVPVFNVQSRVDPYKYSEIYLGEYTNDGYDWPLSFPLSTPDGRSYTTTAATRRLRLQAPLTTGTGIPYNLTLDYIKLVPVF